MPKRCNKNVSRGSTVELVIDGQPVTAYQGETIASVLLLHYKTACYQTRRGRPRMMFCNMGACFECRVRISQAGRLRWVLACVTPVESQMKIDTNIDLSQWIPDAADTL